jgi:hypothetical protein
MTAELALICQTCRKPIDDEEDGGSLRVIHAAVAQYKRDEQRRQMRNLGQAVDLHELLLGPDPANWLAYHDRCDPGAGIDAYHICAERLRTWRDLAFWTAHLMGKNWLALTDWDELLREAAGVVPSVTIRVLERSAA